jgi:hypothetical protein
VRGIPLARPGNRWENNIKLDLKEMGGGMHWINLAQERDSWRALIVVVMNFWVI